MKRQKQKEVEKMHSFVFLTHQPCCSSDKKELKNKSNDFFFFFTLRSKFVQNISFGTNWCLDPISQTEIIAVMRHLQNMSLNGADLERRISDQYGDCYVFFSFVASQMSTVLSNVCTSVTSLHFNSHENKNTFCKPVAKNGFVCIVYHIAIC